MTYWAGYILILMMGVAITAGLVRLYQKLWTNRPDFREISVNLTISLFFLFLTFMAVEFYFKVFFAQSDAFTFTLSAQNWKERYWYPINSLGYRDREWSEQDIKGKLKIMVVGDSLAAGQGINNYQDRFSNKLNEFLGDQAVVFNVASPGWDTRREIQAVVDYPYRPDILILAYFINDVEGAAFHQGVKREKFDIYKPPSILKPLIENSYAFNFLYWRLVRLGQQEGQADYWQWLSEIFETPAIWWVHQQELQMIYEGVQAEGIRLIVVVFPNITTLRESQKITQPVLDFFQGRGVPTIDVAKLVENKEPRELMASPVDGHPNEIVNLKVAEQLYQMIRKWQETAGKDAESR